MNPENPDDPNAQFERDVHIEKPGIVGARWWHKSLVSETRTMERRQLLTGLAIAGGVIGACTVMGVGISLITDDPADKVSIEKRRSLQMQQQFGWDFGARGKELVFDGRSEAPFIRSDLEKLPDVMSPRLYSKYYIPALIESLFSQPAMTLPAPPDGSPRADAAPFRKLSEVIVPVVTPSMRQAYRTGEALARHCSEVQNVAVLADLPGPEAVAFAAGAASRFEPVLLFDNWPHPHGVVPSHLTLAALAYYQPRFAEQLQSRTIAGPLFVLDRSRLAPYSEESDRFDNRYFARMPDTQTLGRDGINLLFYVVAQDNDLPEPADTNAALTAGTQTPAASTPSLTVCALALTDFGDGGQVPPPEVPYYGGSPDTDGSFWVNYPYRHGFQPKEWQTIASSVSKDYRFTPRPASGQAAASVGNVPVLVTGTGLLVAAALDRKGSMNRFSGGWSG